MKLSQLLFRTLKEAPNDAAIPSHRLLERAGYIHKLGKGIYGYTPLMWKVVKKLCAIVRQELDAAGAQEVCLPQLHPKEIWQESERWTAYVCEKLLLTIEDREQNHYCVAPTCEEVAIDLVRHFVKSYRQLPLNIYQIGNKFRDEIRPRFGLMRGKEFIMKDGYSFATDPDGMQQQYELMSKAYCNILDRLELKYAIVEAHGGKISQSGRSQEFQVLADVGEDAIMVCEDYAANIEAAKAIPMAFTYPSNLQPLEEIDTPHVSTIDELSTFLKIPAQQILKTVVYRLIYGDRIDLVAIGIRGDRQLNAVKILSYFGAIEIELASDEEVKALTGAPPGFIGPLHFSHPFYADESARPMTNFVCACNKKDIHMRHVNWGRDVKQPTYSDFLLAEPGDGCPEKEGKTYRLERGIEVGHIFNLGTQYSEKLNARFQDEQGAQLPCWMGTYGIGIGRLAQACVEQKWDDKGIIWPRHIAPFQILITAATHKESILIDEANRLYENLKGFEPLLDDRDERLGFKLKDSDLIGIGYKLIIGKTFLEQNAYEIESRSGEKVLVEASKFMQWAESHLIKQI